MTQTEIYRSCVGTKLVELETSWVGGVTFKFENGVEIRFSDGFASVSASGRELHGAIYEDEVMRATP